jgi:hypothetical protein
MNLSLSICANWGAAVLRPYLRRRGRGGDDESAVACAASSAQFVDEIGNDSEIHEKHDELGDGRGSVDLIDFDG